MKAIVMAGGEGTRLRPLTCGRPKPMVEMFGRSVLERALERLRRLGIVDIRLTLRYLPEKIMDELGDGERLGVRVSYLVEDKSLGTAGSVRACKDFIGEEDVLIVSGDAVWDFELEGILKFHKEQGADATLVLYNHPDPTSFGLVLTDPDGRIRAFSEKPSWERVVTDRVNTGLYVLSPRAVDAIPEDEEYDFGKDLFPRLLREGYALYGADGRGYWCDIGSAASYRQCCMDILAGRVDMDIGGSDTQEARRAGVEILEPVYISPESRLMPGCRLGPNAVIGPGTIVESGARVTESVVNGARLGENCDIQGAILGRGAWIGASARVSSGAVIGDGARIGPSAAVLENVSVWPDRTVKSGAVLTENLTDGTQECPPAFVSEKQMTGTAEALLEAAVGIGAHLGRTGMVGIAHTGGDRARLIADAILCGVTAAGGEGTRADCAFEAELASLAAVFSFRRCVFVRAEEEITVTVLGPAGVPLEPGERKALNSAVRNCVPARVNDVGPVVNITGMPRAYISALCADVRELYGVPRPVCVTVSGDDEENETLRRVLEALGHRVLPAQKGRASVSVSRGGFGFTATDERGRPADEARCALLAAEAAMRLGAGKLAVPADFPEAARRLGAKYGCAVLDGGTADGRELFRRQRFLRDGVLAAAVTVAAMGRDNMEMAGLLDSLPDFAVARGKIDISRSRAEAMRILAETNAELSADLVSGLVAATPHGGVRIRPDGDSPALIVRAEADSMEAAQELLGKYTSQQI